MVIACILLALLAASEGAVSTDETLPVEQLPIIQVKLDPPKHPLPEVEAEVAVLEHGREAKEMEFLALLRDTFDAALIDAKLQISQLVAGAMGMSRTNFLTTGMLEHAPALARVPQGCGAVMLNAGSHSSFFEKGTGATNKTAQQAGFTMKFSLIAPSSPDTSIQAKMVQVENKRSKLEAQLFQEACAEMTALTKLVLRELGRLLADAHHGSPLRHVSFLQRSPAGSQGLPDIANVRLAASENAFPRIRDLIEEMESRRDSSESSERAQILAMELSLLKAENEMAREEILKVAS